MVPDERFDAVMAELIAHPSIRGVGTYVQLAAIGAAESGLDNDAIGENKRNGTPPDRWIQVTDRDTGQVVRIDLHQSLGLGWLQHDSGWLRADWHVNRVAWSVEEIRGGLAFSLDLIVARPGFVLHQGTNQTYIDYTKWAVWPVKSDEFVPQAEAAYDRAVGLA